MSIAQYSEMIDLFERLDHHERIKMVDGMQIDELTIFHDGFIKYRDNLYHGDGWVIYISGRLNEKKAQLRDDKLNDLGI